LSEADVLVTAQREGLVLIEAPGTATGYKGVTKQATTGSCYMARAGGKHLGSFPSACEAALAYARHTSEARRAQGAEGAGQILACAPVCEPQHVAALNALRTSANPYGFTGVSASGKKLKPFKATIPSSLRAVGSNGYVGCFTTAEEAAFAIVSRVGLNAALTLRPPQTTARKSADFYVPLDAAAEDALVAQAKAEAAAAGLTLVVNEKIPSGYNCVQRRVLKRRKQEADAPPCYCYVAYVYRRDHSQMILGTTRTAAEAALIVARHRALSSAQGAGETLMTMRGDDNESAEAMMQQNETMEDCRYVEQDE